MGRARQHAVLGGDPALALATQKGRDALFDTGGTQHMGIPEAHEYRAFGMPGEAALETDGPQLIGGAATGSGHGHGLRQRSTAPVVLSLLGPAAATAVRHRAAS